MDGAIDSAGEALRAARPLLDTREDWPAPDMSLVSGDRAPAPAFPGADVFGPDWADWIAAAADSKSAPQDYVAAGLLAVAGALLGNARWVGPWSGWAEPPVLWTMLVGLPSTGKSPGLDAALLPLREFEAALHREAEHAAESWRTKKIGADAVLKDWEEKVRQAAKDGAALPERPAGAEIGPEPWPPRLAVNDTTVERLVVILGRQPRGTLVVRDELAGWLTGMTRYTTSGGDRAFWLEAHGGRSFVMERMSRDPVRVPRVTVGIVGGIQPDRLASLLLRADDDGLLARFMPVWPEPVPLRRPSRSIDHGFARDAFARLWRLAMPTDEAGEPRPWIVPFDEPARAILDDVRDAARAAETGAEGLLLSLVGKLPGMVVRLSLVLAHLDWVTKPDDAPPDTVTGDACGRAAHYVVEYVLPMARRAYADAAAPGEERGAATLARLILAERPATFTSRDIQHRKLSGLRTAKEIQPALEVLTAAGWVTYDPQATRTKPRKLYRVNPRLERAP